MTKWSMSNAVETIWKEKTEKPKTLSATLEHLTQKNIHQMFPNIVRTLSIIVKYQQRVPT